MEHRFLPVTQQDRLDMLAACGKETIEDLLVGIPSKARYQGFLDHIGRGYSEHEIKKMLSRMLSQSRSRQSALSFLGAGVYDHFCPSVVNQLTLRGEFLTSYTPYQAEMAQGTLQALYEFQSMVSTLFGMPISNASHYDGATSMAEAVLMAARLKPERRRILVSEGVHPEYVAVLKTYLTNFQFELEFISLTKDGQTSLEGLSSALDSSVATVVVQSPNFYGCVEEMESLSAMSKSHGALFTACVTEPLSLALLQSPGEYDADIAVGEGQSFGLPQSFGGPYLGLFTSKMEFVRQMPGRLCGQTVDALGRRSYTLTLSTREQHIRRDKATSNICTNQNLCALWATIWLSLLGKQGFHGLAEQNLAKAEYAKERILGTGKAALRYPKAQHFNEFVIDLNNVSSAEMIRHGVAQGLAPGVALERFSSEDKTGLLIAVTEKKSKEDIDQLVDLIKKYG